MNVRLFFFRRVRQLQLYSRTNVRNTPSGITRVCSESIEIISFVYRLELYVGHTRIERTADVTNPLARQTRRQYDFAFAIDRPL